MPHRWTSPRPAPGTREQAVTEIVRGRLQGLGPVTARELADSLQIEPSCISVALAELESEGFVLRGRFSEEASAPEAIQQGDATLEWCERRLLARIHRYTIKTLRAEIEPVSSADFMRFLLEWQGVTRQPKPEGVESLAAVIAQLEGYEIPAAAWEGDVLAARLHDYDPHWLDSLCLSGARCGRDSRRRSRVGCRAGAHHAHRAGHAARTGRCGIRWRRRRTRKCSCLMARAPCTTISALTAPRSSTTW